MRAVVEAASLVVAAAAVAAGCACLAATRSVLVALPVLLDLLLAAGLLRLALTPTPAQLAAVAALLVVKRVASYGIRNAQLAHARPEQGRR